MKLKRYFRSVPQSRVITSFLLLQLCLGVQITAKSSCTGFCNVPSKWMRQASNVCHGARDKNYGYFNIQQDCKLVAIRLTHISGFLTGYKKNPGQLSRWGANFQACPICLSTLILKEGKLWLPNEIGNRGSYGLHGFDVDDDVLIFKKRANLTAGDKLQIAYGVDYKGTAGPDRDGYHCMDIDVSCLI